MKADLLISIINYRTPAITLACVESVLADMRALDKGINAQVVVVDNASGDDSCERIEAWLAEQRPGTPVRLLRSATNSGFSGGHNQAMAAVAADHVLVLNSDAILRPGFLHHILAAARAHPEAGLIAPTIETESGEVQVSQFRFHSPLSELDRGAQSGPVTRLLRRHVVALTPPADPAQIDWVSFACVLLNGRMIDRIGPMDEGYFLYFEDAEYCLRARRAGWRIALAPQAVMVHYRGGSGPVKRLEQARKRLPRYFYSSRSRFLRQAHGPTGPLRANLMWLLGRGLAQLRYLTGRRPTRILDHEARDIWIDSLRAPPSRPASGDPR